MHTSNHHHHDHQNNNHDHKRGGLKQQAWQKTLEVVMLDFPSFFFGEHESNLRPPWFVSGMPGSFSAVNLFCANFTGCIFEGCNFVGFSSSRLQFSCFQRCRRVIRCSCSSLRVLRPFISLQFVTVVQRSVILCAASACQFEQRARS